MAMCASWLVCATIGWVAYTLILFRPYADEQIEMSGSALVRADPVIGFSMQPHATRRRIELPAQLDYTVHSDGRGARVDHPGEESSPSAELMIVGGSFAWGHGVANEDTFARRLADALDLSMANFALGSYGTVQALQMLQRQSDDRPRLVLYAFITHHLERNVTPCAPSLTPFCTPVAYVGDGPSGLEIRGPIGDFRPERNRAFVREVINDRHFDLDDLYWSAAVTYERVRRRIMARPKAPRGPSMSYLLQAMVEQVQRMGARLIVAYIPYLERDDTRDPPAELLQALPESVVFVDLAPAVRRHYAGAERPLLRFERDGHPNELGHELIASELVPVVRRILVDPDGTRRQRSARARQIYRRSPTTVVRR